MAEESQNPNGKNPLDEVADDLSAGLTGETVDVRDSSVEEVQGGQIKMNNSAARSLRAQAMDMRESAVAMAQVDSLEMHESAAGGVIGKSVSTHGGVIGIGVAERFHASDTTVGLLVAGEVEGNVKVLLTPGAAAAFGAAFAVALTLLRLLFRRKPK
ncbi:MAG: hypothetical protein WBO46_14135 [Caldilineaceae bacterium]